MASINDKLEKADKRKQQLQLQKKYGTRITTAKQAREAFLKKDYINAVKKYNEYLGILAELNDLEDIFQLNPTHFDQKNQVTEMLLISHVYWELARTYEMTPKFQTSFDKCINQFVKFTANQPYQVFNAEMLRKYIKKNRLKSNQIGRLNEAYAQIYVQSKKCFIATYCFGDQHPVTNDLRLLKRWLIQSRFGMELTRYYYIASPKIITAAKRYVVLDKTISYFVKPTLRLVAKIVAKSRIE
jgi:hypothetical protein